MGKWLRRFHAVCSTEQWSSTVYMKMPSGIFMLCACFMMGIMKFFLKDCFPSNILQAGLGPVLIVPMALPEVYTGYYWDFCHPTQCGRKPSQNSEEDYYPSGEKRRETDSFALIHRDRFLYVSRVISVHLGRSSRNAFFIWPPYSSS
jgi:hypothetical protein